MKKAISLFMAGIMAASMVCVPVLADGAAPETIKMAALYGFTGSGSQVAESCKSAIDMMVDIINEEGGIKNFGGAQLEVVYGDNQSNEDVSKTTAERVLADEDILYCIGAGSSALLLPMLPTTEKLHVPVLTNNSGNSITEQGYKYVFRCCDKSSTIPELKLDFYKWLGEEMGFDLNKIGVMYIDMDYGVSAAESAKELYSQIGTVIEYESFPGDISDMSALVAKFKASDVQIIDFTAELQNAKLLYDTMKIMDYHPLIIGGGGGMVQLEFAENLGDDAIGIVSSLAFTTDQKNVLESEELSGYVDRYKDLYGKYPDENAIFAIEEMMVARNGMETAAEPTREALRDALAASSTDTFCWWQPITFDETGNDTGASWVMGQWRKDEEGKFYISCIYPAEAASSEFVDPRQK